MNCQNARFFENINGEPVKITLRDGETIHHRSGGETDDGWSFTTHYWSFETGVLTCESVTRSRDCDGRMDHNAVFKCPMTRLRAGVIDSEHRGVVYPAWEAVKRSQRDYSAEAAGY